MSLLISLNINILIYKIETSPMLSYTFYLHSKGKFHSRNHLFSFTLLAVRIRRQFSRETSEKCKEKTRYLFAYIHRHNPMTFWPCLSSDPWSARSLELTKPFRIGNYISHHPQERRTLQRILPFQNQRGIHVLICTFTNRLQSAIAVICHNPVLWLITYAALLAVRSHNLGVMTDISRSFINR